MKNIIAYEINQFYSKENRLIYRLNDLSINNQLAYTLARQFKFKESISVINSALEKYPYNTELYDSKGEIFLLQGKNDEALAMWKKVMELNPNFLDKHPNGTELSNGLKKLGLIE